MIQTILFLGVLFVVFIVCVILGACAASRNSGNVIILSTIDIKPTDNSEC